MRLTDDELRDVLSRAEEIERASRQGKEWDAELAAVIGAAEEVGLSRHAVVRALKERNLSATRPVVGTLVWAESADGKFYVAEVMSTQDDGARVRFLRGTEHSVTLDQLRPYALIPGERVVCNWPWWGQWTCTVVAYDHAKQRVKLNDGWGYNKTFRVSEIWLAPAKPESRGARARMYLAFMAAGSGVGALIGSAITALLMR